MERNSSRTTDRTYKQHRQGISTCDSTSRVSTTLPSSILRLSDLYFQIAHRQYDGVIFPIHIRLCSFVQRHVEFTEEVRQCKIQLRVCQAVSG